MLHDDILGYNGVWFALYTYIQFEARIDRDMKLFNYTKNDIIKRHNLKHKDFR